MKSSKNKSQKTLNKIVTSQITPYPLQQKPSILKFKFFLGGGNIQIHDVKPDFGKNATSKVGSMVNVSHTPGMYVHVHVYV